MEPHFPHGLPGTAVIESLLQRLEQPGAYLDTGIDAAIRQAFGLGEGFHGRYVDSCDDALDLVGAVLPGWSIDMQGNRMPGRWELDRFGGDGPFLYVTIKEWRGGQSFTAHTPPCVGRTKGLSVCIALFSVLKARIDNGMHLPETGRVATPGAGGVHPAG